MRKSIGARFLIVGLLTLLMFIPLFFVSDIVQSRKNYSQYTLNEVGREWGGEQVIAGPMLMIPVEETVERTEREAVVDPKSGEIVLDADGSPRQRQVTRKVTVTRDPIYVYPGRFDVAIDTQTQIRHRGIFSVPVYQSGIEMGFDFPWDQIATQAVNEEVILWDRAELILSLSSNARCAGKRC